jgi:GNAT superfamily N-acetyltransferase
LLPQKIHIEQLCSADDVAAFDAFITIYQQSLLPSEQKPAAEMHAMLDMSQYYILLARVDETVIGFSVIFISNDADWALLEYMAIAEAQRSHGYGQALFNGSCNFLFNRLNKVIPLLLEVDSPQSGDTADNERVRRERFYQRLGCKTVEGLNYKLPALNALTPPPMQLMVLTPTTSYTPSLVTVRKWLSEIYRSVYGRPTTDPNIEAMLAPLSEPISLI